MSSSNSNVAQGASNWAGDLAAAGMKLLILTHRYVGMAMGLLMTLWCLSGFVMMYASFPNLTTAERLKGLEPLKLPAGCCDLSAIKLDPEATLSDLRVEMLLGRPVLRVSQGSRAQAYDLQTGAAVNRLSLYQVAQVAQTYAAGAGIAGKPNVPQLLAIDEWTVSHAARAQPMYRVRFDDPAASEIYISAASGLVVQDTNRKERILGWLGPVPHWLYPTILKQNNALWTQVVIWSATVGVFLTVFGLWIGIVRLRKRPNGRWSPYRGVMWLHHVPGLIFGVLTLTWVFSGLMTMGPWGLLRGSATQVRREFLGAATWEESRALLTHAAAIAGPGVLQIEGAPFGGKLYALANTAAGARRFGGDGRPAGLNTTDLLAAAKAADMPVRDLILLQKEDNYYYGQDSAPLLPVFRLTFADAGRTSLYIDPKTARVMRAVDTGARQRRWAETSLHDLDFAWIRKKPIWDMVVLALLAGVTFLCGTGFWLGLRRLKRDLSAARLMLGRWAARN